MAKQSDFNSFLKDIEPSTTTVSYISSIQTNLRDYLKSHESYKFVHTDTFLSGSYANTLLFVLLPVIKSVTSILL